MDWNHNLKLDRSRTMRWSMKHFLMLTRTFRFDSCHITLVDQWEEDWYDPRSKFLLTPTSKRHFGNNISPKSLLSVDEQFLQFFFPTGRISHGDAVIIIDGSSVSWQLRSQHARVAKPETPLGSRVLLRPAVKLLQRNSNLPCPRLPQASGLCCLCNANHRVLDSLTRPVDGSL